MHTALNFTDSILKETSGPDYLTNENSLIILGLVLFVINLIIYQKEIRGNINITI